MFINNFKLSQPEKERLIRIKARTGVKNWNTLCRWAFCWSLAQSSIPDGVVPPSDSIEMDWLTFGGEGYADIYEALLRQRCVNDGLDTSKETLIKYFRLHLRRGINHFSTRGVLTSDIKFLDEICDKKE